MEEEIDLRAYIAVLWKGKYWIAGLALVAALVALGVSFLLPPKYEATALVAVTKPRYTLQFDSKLETSNIQPSYKAYLDLATSDQLIMALVDDLESSLEVDERTVRVVREMLDVQSGADASIIKLTVQNGSPERVALIANHWAALLVDRSGELYEQGEQDRAFFEAQLADAKQTLAQAEQALIDFQTRNEVAILQAQLENKQAELYESLGLARALGLSTQDAQALLARFQTQAVQTQATLNDELAVLLLEVTVRNDNSLPVELPSSETSQRYLPTSTSGGNSLPVELQISSPNQLDKHTIGDLSTRLEALIGMLEAKLTQARQNATAVQPEILSLQESLTQAQIEEDRLKLAKSVASETVLTLSRKVAETQIAAGDETGAVRLVSQAVVPDRPVAPRKMVNTAVAGVLGLFVGVLGVFAVEYWRGGEKRPKEV